MPTFPQKRSVMLHVVTFAGGAAAAISVAASHSIDLYSAYDHFYAGVKEIIAGWAILAPVLSISAAAFYGSTKNKILDVAADPKAPQIAAEIAPTPQVTAIADALKAPPSSVSDIAKSSPQV